ncbi:MAG: hypothetical protein ACLU0O_10830 [Collinsella sp.]
MATKEEISMVGFEIVAYAGDAQTDLLQRSMLLARVTLRRPNSCTRMPAMRSSVPTTRRPSCFRRRPAVARWR